MNMLQILSTPLPVWPIAIWPAMSLSLLYAVFWYNGYLRQNGSSIAEKSPRAFLPVLLMLAVLMNALETASILFFLYKFGFGYVCVLLLCVALGVFWRAALYFIPGAVVWAPLLHMVLIALTLNVLGILQSPIIEAINRPIWDLAETVDISSF